MVQVKVFPYYRELLSVAPEKYLVSLERLVTQVFSSEPWGKLAAQIALQAGTPFDLETLPDSLATLSSSRMEQLAEAELTRLVGLEPPHTPAVECHLFPCLNVERRGGFCFAPGKLLILVPMMAQWEKRLVRNITHEYSHTLRMTLWPLDQRHGFGPTFRYTIREHLVFEGLAENLVEQFYPDPDFPVEVVTNQEEDRFWEAVHPHFDKENWDAYGVLMNPAPGLPRRSGYTVGYRLVRSYLERHGLTALAAHTLPYDELYWNSGYRSIR